MSTTPRVVAQEIRGALEAMVDTGIAMYANDVKESPRLVSWNTPDHTWDDFLLRRNKMGVSSYIHWLQTNQYSAVLADGALLQISYLFDVHEIVGHRLAYVPCPVKLGPDTTQMLEAGFGLDYLVIDKLADSEAIFMKSIVRFDYDPANARDDHPATHLTLNSVDCRIACAAPVRVGRFVDFVFRHFYASEHRKYSFIREMPADGWFKPTLSSADRESAHIVW